MKVFRITMAVATEDGVTEKKLQNWLDKNLDQDYIGEPGELGAQGYVRWSVEVEMRESDEELGGVKNDLWMEKADEAAWSAIGK